MTVARLALTFAMGLVAVSVSAAPYAMAADTPHPSEMYEDLREMALKMRPSDIGLKLPDGATTAYGVVMDIGVQGGTATVTGFASGDASLYLSTGGGVLGGVGHESVREAAKAWVNAAQAQLTSLRPTSEFPTPSQGSARFYVLTNHGPLTAEASIAALEAGSDPASALWAAGQQVLTAIRLTSQHPGR